MTNFLFNYGWILLVVVLTILYILWVFKKRGKKAAIEEARKLILQYMFVVQKKLGKDGKLTGGDKFTAVLELVWTALPESLKAIFGDKNAIAKEIQEQFDKTMDLLDDGVVNGSINQKKLDK
jgi:cbb3-type cytochrome oxidase subunit 3